MYDDAKRFGMRGAFRLAVSKSGTTVNWRMDKRCRREL